jgi:hypothetical protein
MLITGGERGKEVFWMNDCPQNREICPAALGETERFIKV